MPENNCWITKLASNNYEVRKRNGDKLGNYFTLSLAKERACRYIFIAERQKI